MNRAVDATATKQTSVRSVDNRIDIELRDVAADDGQRYFSHQAGFRSFTRENQRHIGIRTASTAAQHR
jgi:hypothetical protein